MAGDERGKGHTCGVENCRSKKFSEGEDGFLYCENGHQNGNLVIGTDDDDFEGAARRDKTSKKKNTDGKVKFYQNLKGSQAMVLYLESLQLILRHQLWFLTHNKRLPAELETVVRDLWAMRISQFEEKISDEKQQFDSSQAFPASDSEADAAKAGEAYQPREKKLRETPTLIDCLVLCYLGAITLRLPITPGDIYAWTTEENMRYRRAITFLPPIMRYRLPNTYFASLNPDSLLPMHRFYGSLIDIQRRFEIEYGIQWPSLNVPVLLFRYLKELALPLELYDATIRLGKTLDYDFTLHTKGRRKIGVRHVPEAQLIACLVVCVKLFFPFDDEHRYPKSNAEPAATTINWPEWSIALKSAEIIWKDDNQYTTENLTKLKEQDVFNMSGYQLDQFLDLSQRNYIDESQKFDEFRTLIIKMFPVTEDNNNQAPATSAVHDGNWEAVRTVHSGMKPAAAIRQGEGGVDIRRPGQEYVVWKREEFLPENAKTLYKEAAKVAGLTLKMMVLSVFAVEINVEKWKRRQRVANKV